MKGELGEGGRQGGREGGRGGERGGQRWNEEGVKKELLGWDSNPRHTAYEADALPTELPRQLTWLGRIKATQCKGNQSNLT